MSPETFARLDNRQLDVIAIRQDRNKSAQGYKFQTVAEMSAAPVAKDWLIKGIFARGESSAWIAPPKALKSALLAQASICVAANLDWHGYRSKGAWGVVYFALERADLVRRRILAHVARLGIGPPPIVVVGDMIDPRNVKRIIATIREAEESLGVQIGLVIFDTFAKLIAAGGGDENSAKDQGAVFASVQRIKNLTGAHVALIGHTGKDEEKGARGSNAILGDVDLMARLSGTDVRTATVSHANDAPEGPLFSFKSEVHTFGTDDDGDPITVNIVSGEQPDPQEPATREPKLRPNQQTIFAMLHAAGKIGLTLEQWNSQAKDAGIGIKRKADLTDIRNALLTKGLVRNYGDRWHVIYGSG